MAKKPLLQTLALFGAYSLFVGFPAAYGQEPQPAFVGKVDVMARDSVPAWPTPIRMEDSAPNIVVILLDDIGFGDASTFGGAAQTPHLDKLARAGLRYNNFNVTAMCSPTRAALLTGRNHHRVGSGVIADFAGGYPGYNSIWKESTASVAEVLRRSGYSTSAFGKWHNTPDWEITSTGPFDRWPTGRGFEYFYGFMGPAGAENHWEPTKLYRNTVPVDAPRTPEQGYHLTNDITDDAIGWIDRHRSLAADKPYFLYFAPGAVHIPHHAPRDWIDRYRGKFDAGWDVLNEEVFRRQKGLGVIPKDAQRTPRPEEFPAWASLSADQKRLYARQMEVYAGFIAHTDHEIGRLLDAIRSGPDGDNTLIFYIVGDNGAMGLKDVPEGFATGSSSKQLDLINELGGPEVPMNLYANGWAWAGNTPFPGFKMDASQLGGLRTPMVVSWPARIKDVGAVRSQFAHVTDITATIYDVLGLTPPSRINDVDQQPLDGVSLARTLETPDAPSQHRLQYFEMLGNRGMYKDGWFASARHKGESLLTLSRDDFSKDRWELYNLNADFSQSRDLSAAHPDKLDELRALFDSEARRNDVYPLGAALSGGKPSLTAGKTEFVYFPGDRIPRANIPSLRGISYLFYAEATIPPSGAQGVLLKCGDRFNGLVFYLKDRRLSVETVMADQRATLVSNATVPSGEVELGFEFKPERSGRPDAASTSTAGSGRLLINGKAAGAADISAPDCRGGTGDPSLFVGRNAGPLVSANIPQLFTFSGALRKVTLSIGENERAISAREALRER
jgi:arylsulfatase